MNWPDNLQTWKHNSAVNEDTMRQLEMLSPLTIIDVGAGDGFYGKLVKYLFPKSVVVGVEKRQSYVVDFNLGKIYDKIIVDDVINVIDSLSGDLIIFGDVLEHLVKADMIAVLKKGVQNFCFVIVNSPRGFQAQEHEYPEELHRCGIDYPDFEVYKVLEYHLYCNGAMFNCLLNGIK